MAAHAEDALRRLRVAEVFDLSLTIPASKARSAKGLFTCKDCEVFDLVTAGTTAVGAVVTY